MHYYPNKNLTGFITDAKNPLIKAQLKIRNTIRDEYKLEDILHIEISQWCTYDSMFKANKIDYRFKSWSARGITTL